VIYFLAFEVGFITPYARNVAGDNVEEHETTECGGRYSMPNPPNDFLVDEEGSTNHVIQLSIAKNTT
jgi:hypothetical protein